MKIFYCKYLKRYVFFNYCESQGVLKVNMFAHSNGEFINCITLNYFTGNNSCCYIDNKTYPWLPTWLVEKNIAHPTYFSLCKDGFSYFEFKFNKEEF